MISRREQRIIRLVLCWILYIGAALLCGEWFSWRLVVIVMLFLWAHTLEKHNE